MLYKVSNVWKLALNIVISGFLFCYTFAVFNPSAENVGATLNWGDQQDLYTTLFSTIIPVGSLIGATTAGSLMNTYGRRKTIIISDIIMICGSILSVIPFTFIFGLGRLICGIAGGIFMTISSSFVNEITPDEMLPQVGPLVQISTNVGLLCAFVFGLPLPNSGYDSSSFNEWWIFMFAFPGIVSLYQLFYFQYVFKYDSPLWLFRKGDKEEAMKCLSMIYTEEGMSIGLNRFSQKDEESENLLKSDNQPLTYKEIFTNLKYRKMLRNGIILGIIQPGSGINTGVFYSTYIFQDLGAGDFLSKLYTVVFGVVFLIAVMCSGMLLSRFGRRPLLISGQILLAIDLCMLGLINLLFDAPAAVLIIGVLLIFILFSYSVGATLWLYIGEVLIEKILGISVVFNLIWLCITTAVFPVVVEYLDISYAFLFFGVSMILGSVYCSYDLIETRGKTKPEIFSEMLYTG